MRSRAIVACVACCLAALGCSSSDSPADATVDSTPVDIQPDVPADGVPADLTPADQAYDWPPDVSVDTTTDAFPPESRGPAQHCNHDEDCKDGRSCVSGEQTSSHCAVECTSDQSCADEAPGSQGSCIPVSGGGVTMKICVFFCGMLADNKPCPGDLVCEGNAVCR